MIQPKSLNSLIKESGLTKDDLNKRMKREHCDRIATLVGQDWESLATAIRFKEFEVNDIKEKYRHQEPRDGRIALLRKWRTKYGSDATYANMIHGLEEVQNRELTELVIKQCRECIQKKRTHVDRTEKGLKHHHTNTDHKSKIDVLILVFILMYSLLLCGCLTIGIQRKLFVILETSHVHIDSAMDLYFSNLPKDTNCSLQVGHDLPLLHGHFVGRENDIREVITKVKKTNILNINGAPGFGKSTLAIHAGYRLVQNCTSVRYINMEELSQKVLSEFTDKSERKSKTEWKSANKFERQTTLSALTANTATSTLVMKENVEFNTDESSDMYVEKLKQWSKSINCTTVLILDNTDIILVGSLRKKFINVITSLIHSSELHLHIIVVSREKVLFLENFDWWTVRELSQQASVELLNELTPDIASNHMTVIAELLQGHPLALKITGSILHVYGKDSIPEMESELKNRPINVLDKVDSHDYGQNFSLMMDSILNQLEFFRECGYTVSLFPGSFSKEAGREILSSIKCLEMLEKHSLLDEYYLGYQHWYKMHRLIREYLHEKVEHNDKILFVEQFCKYYIQFLLRYAKENELNDIDEHILSSESKNIDLLEESLLSTMQRNFSARELAVLAFLLSKDHTQMEKLQSMFKLYLKTLDQVCQLLDPAICGGLISDIVKHFYFICKCDTITKFFQKVLEDPCTDIFDCITILNIRRMQSNLNISQQQEALLYHIETLQCLYIYKLLDVNIERVYFIGLVTTVTGLLVIVLIMESQFPLNYKNFLYNLGFMILCILIMIACSPLLILRFSLQSLKNKQSCVLCIQTTCACTILPLIVGIILHLLSRLDMLLIIEVGAKMLCYTCIPSTTLTIIFGYYLCIHEHTSFCLQNRSHWTIIAMILIFSIIRLFIHFSLSVCSQLPICH